MKTGDLVRFCQEEIHPMQHNLPEWNHGLLIEYRSWEKIARILYRGEMISVSASNVQLASRAKEEI
jgi:hypothetical protein